MSRPSQHFSAYVGIAGEERVFNGLAGRNRFRPGQHQAHERRVGCRTGRPDLARVGWRPVAASGVKRDERQRDQGSEAASWRTPGSDVRASCQPVVPLGDSRCSACPC